MFTQRNPIHGDNLFRSPHTRVPLSSKRFKPVNEATIHPRDRVARILIDIKEAARVLFTDRPPFAESSRVDRAARHKLFRGRGQSANSKGRTGRNLRMILVPPRPFTHLDQRRRRLRLAARSLIEDALRAETRGRCGSERTKKVHACVFFILCFLALVVTGQRKQARESDRAKRIERCRACEIAADRESRTIISRVDLLSAIATLSRNEAAQSDRRR